MPKRYSAQEAIDHANTLFSGEQWDIAMIAELRNRLLTAGVSEKRPALYYGDSITMYEELFNAVLIVADSLRSRGIERGARVAFFLPDCPLMEYIILAAAEIGAVYCGMNIKASRDENTVLLRQSGARLLIHDDSLDQAAPRVEGLGCLSRNELEKRIDGNRHGSIGIVSETDHDIDFGISFTSGTTGISKGVFHTVADYFLCAEACIEQWGLGADDILFSSAPLLTTLSLGSAVFPALLSGGGLVISGKRTAAEIIATIERYHCTFLVANPTICRRILMEKASRGDAGSTLKAVTVAGAPVNPEIGASFRREFMCRVYPHYGMTETLAITSTGTGSENNTVGRPLEHVRLRIEGDDRTECSQGETGAIKVKSRTMTSRYLQTDSTPSIDGNGWFDTGDRGFIDAAGDLRIAGRCKEMIIRNGNNVYIQEIECLLLQHARIIDCAVIGVPEPDLGEKIVAFVACRDALTAHDLRRFLSPTLPVYKIPDEIVFIGELPRNANHKINREHLKERYQCAGASLAASHGTPNTRRTESPA